jgi:hypothetical protein
MKTDDQSIDTSRRTLTPGPSPIRLAAQALAQRVGEGGVGLSPFRPAATVREHGGGGEDATLLWLAFSTAAHFCISASQCLGGFFITLPRLAL